MTSTPGTPTGDGTPVEPASVLTTDPAATTAPAPGPQDGPSAAYAGSPGWSTPPPGAQPPPAGAARGSGLDRFFDQVRQLQIWRDPQDKWVAGICSGIGRRFGVDPVIVRAALICLTIFAGVGVFAYLLGWLLLPSTDGTILGEKAIRQGDGGGIALAVLIALIFVSAPGDWWKAGIFVPLAIVGWGIYTANKQSPAGSPHPSPPGYVPSSGASSAPPYVPENTMAPTAVYQNPVGYAAPPPRPPMVATPAPPRPKRRPAGGPMQLLVLGLALVAGGIGYALADAELVTGGRWFVATAASLLVLSVACLAIGIIGRKAGAVSGFTVTAAIWLGIVSLIPSNLNFDGSVGTRTWEPTTTVASSYALSVGDATLDLSGTDPTALDSKTITVEMGLGELTIVPPEGFTTTVNATVDIGEIRDDATQRRRAGISIGPDSDRGAGEAMQIIVGDGPKSLTIDAAVNVGQITVQDAR